MSQISHDGHVTSLKIAPDLLPIIPPRCIPLTSAINLSIVSLSPTVVVAQGHVWPTCTFSIVRVDRVVANINLIVLEVLIRVIVRVMVGPVV